MGVVSTSKNHIVLLRNVTEIVGSQSGKHRLTNEHFKQHIGTSSQHSHHIDSDAIQWQPRQLHHLELPFWEQEVKTTIQAMPNMKAPGPDEFIGIFFKSFWMVIKDDLMRVVNQFFNMNQQGLHLSNQALVVLISKKPDAERVSDFRPTSLIHSFAKILCKMMANRFAPEMDKHVSYRQNAFIKKRNIHDNFMYIHQVIKDL
jgi:hypothetical protein